MALWDPQTSASLVFQTRHSGGTSLWYISQGPGCPMWDTSPSLLWEMCLSSKIPPHCVLRHWGGFYKIVSLPLLPFSMWSFYLLLWRRTHLKNFRSFPEGNDPCVGADLGVYGRRLVQDLPTLPSWTLLNHCFLLLQ